jgi:xanthine dehydrogenase accessory factor
MDGSLTQLVRYYESARGRHQAMVLATILRTEGSTYRKAGARILIGEDGSSSGLLSGGCLEVSLREHALQVLARGRPKRVWFDSRNDDDPVWGLGMGCEGAMDVWLEPLSAANGFFPMPFLTQCWSTRSAGTVATIVGGDALEGELGRHSDPAATQDALGSGLQSCQSPVPRLLRWEFEGRSLEVFTAPVELPTQVLLCGAGRDAIPVHVFVAALGWSVCVYDHRPAYATGENFPQARQVILGRPEELGERLDLQQFDAAVIMSHHLQSDVVYLDALALAELKFIGLLGPAARRARILSDLKRPLGDIERNLYGPVGLDIGGSTPESIALSIVAQMHAALSGRAGGSFDQRPRNL